MGTPNLDYLRERVDRLKKLLDDPHPGLVSWSIMYGQAMQEIVDFWSAPDPQKPESNERGTKLD